MVGLRPLASKGTQRSCVLKGSRSLFQQGQIMHWVKNILFASITARMAGNHLVLPDDLHAKGIGFEHQFTPCFLSRDRVAVGLIHHLTVGRELHLACDTTGEWTFG